MSLREAIKIQHDMAEAHPLTAFIMSGQMTSVIYHDMLCNLLVVYKAIEQRAQELGLLETLSGIERSALVEADIKEFGLENFGGYESVNVHAARVRTLDRQGVLAHMYVTHMGDMYGGQLLKTKLPGSCKRFDFNDRGQLVSNLRAMLTDDLADEACQAFNFTLDLFDDISNKYDLWSIGQSEEQSA